ncbi:MAG TPA: hypothetical protein VHX15_20480 [Frankiaceae bacterium]|nr:hypothetical protein [Frankiaceae bacterium]
MERVRALAASDEDVDTDLWWSVQTNGDASRITAATQDAFDSAEAAFEQAVSMLETILGEEFALRWTPRVTAVGACDDDGDITGWRGFIDIGIDTRAAAGSVDSS